VGEVVKFKRPTPVHKRKTLCRHGFHKWVLDQAQQFDVKLGRLVTVHHCERCGKRRIQAL
jgi:hypothetical protein